MDTFFQLDFRRLTFHCLVCLLSCISLACSSPSNAQETTQENAAWLTKAELDVDEERRRFAAEMGSLAEKARQLKLSAEAEIAESQVVRFDSDRQTIFMPSGMLRPAQQAAESAGNPSDESNDQKSFNRRLKKSKQEFAANLFALVPKLVADEKAAAAYQLLHEVLVYDPLHVEARRILGFRKHEEYGWIRSAKTTRAGKGRTDRKLIGWKKGSYSTIVSPHFKIYSAPGEEAGLKLAAELERTYWVWRQVFFEYHSGTRQVSEWLNTERADPHSSRQYEVYLFRDRQQYNRDLAVVEGIEESTGYYDNKAKASFFYLDEDVQLATWRHETVHQLLQENAGPPINAGTAAHAWLVEGVALYFETMKVYENYVTLGGWDADRLQYARRRLKNEGFFIPMQTFDSINRDDLQARSDKGRVYTQAAGVAQFLMSAEQGRYRNNFIQFVRQYYRERKMKQTLAEQTMPLDQLDRHYKAYLDVSAEQIRTTLADPRYDKTQLKALSIGCSGLTDEDMPLLKGCRQLEWLALSQNRIGDASVKQIAELPEMQILYMANTGITDACIESLLKMPNLSSVDLRKTKVTAEAVRRLKAAKPTLEVIE